MSWTTPYIVVEGQRTPITASKVALFRLFGIDDASKLQRSIIESDTVFSGLSDWMEEITHQSAEKEEQVYNELCRQLCTEFPIELTKFLKEGKISYVFCHGTEIFIAGPISSSIDFTLLEDKSCNDCCIFFDGGVLKLFTNLNLVNLNQIKIEGTKGNFTLENKDSRFKLLVGVTGAILLPTAAVLVNSENEDEESEHKVVEDPTTT
jgi:Pyruvate/2-oxoacid:ferredoxin oxidoreductase delta subunit